MKTVLLASAVVMSTLLAPERADAAQPRAGGVPADVLAEDHPMGSQIRKHEGGDGNANKTAPNPGVAATVPGIDVSGWQGDVDWKSWWNQGKRFVYVKATEGTTYRNPHFAQQYNGSYDVGMIRGAYHFALPDRSSGAAQANFFVDNGGGWSADGKTLPGVADLEYNPYGATCYGKNQAQMAAWITEFADTYRSRTGRDAVFYTSTNWWTQCVGTAARFSTKNPLWLARYSSSIGALPYDWSVWTIWQYTSTPIDQNYFNGTLERLKVLATG